MNIENMKRLAVALESGEYKQTKGALRRNSVGGGSHYCALGVACDVFDRATFPAGKSGWVDRESEGMGYVYYAGEGRGSFNALPVVVRDWYGFADVTGAVYDAAAIDVVGMNDHYGLTFEQIAEYLRRYIERAQP